MSEIYNESNQLSNNYCDIDIKENQKDYNKQSSEHSSINTLATNSSQHLTTSKKEHSRLSTENTLNNSHSTLNSGESNKVSHTTSNHSKMTQIHENEVDGHITKQAFAKNSGSIPNSVQSSENSLNSKTPTEKRSLNNIAKNANNNDKVFDLNDKHLSITLSCHSSESANSINKEEEMENKKSSSKDSKKNSSKEKSDKGDKGEKDDDKGDKGNKKFGFKHFKSTISKTFSKASFRKFSTNHKNKINGTTTGCITEKPEDLGFTTKEEQEEFNNFVNTLNMKKSKQRPSLNGLFLNPELSTPNNNTVEDSLPSTIKEEPPSPQPQSRKKSIKGSTDNVKDAPPEMNEMKNIEGNAKRQAPVIMGKGRRIK